MTTIRVLLADDHELFRAGLRALLQGLEGVQVVAEAADGLAAVRLTATRKPDVVLMNVALPHMNGWDATAQLARESPTARVLLLADQSDQADIARALKAGARGYLLNTATIQELDVALHAVARGDTYLGPHLAKAILEEFRTGGEGHSEAERLTLRQREIVQLIAEGHTSKQIADLLGLSVRTVDRHRAQVMARLEVHSVANLVRWAIRSGLAVTTDR